MPLSPYIVGTLYQCIVTGVANVPTLNGQTEVTVRDSTRARKPTERRYFLGGSDARIIMGTDEAALIRLWREKRGEVEPEDLSGNLVVQLGLATEELKRIG
jgi:predicted phage-related endonuclease